MTVLDAVRSAAVGAEARAQHGGNWLRTYVAVLVLVDTLAVALGGWLAFALRFGDAPTGEHEYLIASLLLPIPWVALVAAARAYEPRFLGVGSEEFRRVLTAAVWLTAVVGTLSWATKAEVARGYVVLALPVACLGTLLGRYLARKRLHALRGGGACMHDAIAIGHAGPVAELVRQARREPYHGLRIIGACTPGGGPAPALTDLGIPVLGAFDDAVGVVTDMQVDSVAVLSCPEMDGPALRRLSWALEGSQTELTVAPALIDVAGPRIAIRPVCGLPLLHVEQPEFSGARRVLKGGVDRLAAAVALLLLTPLLVAVALAVKIDSRGPVLFRQERVGRHGKLFTILKFRTMNRDAESQIAGLAHLNRADGVLFKIPGDPRMTRVGRLLRRFSVDELPQLLNVLIGSMSLVGPRPPLPAEVAKYHVDVRRRLLVKPGLTGLWQVSGRADLDWDEAVRLDLRYVENWSLTLDLLILWKTVAVVLRGRGAY